MSDFKTVPEKKGTQFFVGNIKPGKAGRNRRESTMVEVNRSAWGATPSRRKTKVSKRGSFMRIHSGKALQQPKKKSVLGNLMNNMINKQFKEDSESESDTPMVEIIRCWGVLRGIILKIRVETANQIFRSRR